MEAKKLSNQGELIFFCGKMGSGKSTYSKKLSQEIDAIYLSEDDWLSKLYPDEMNNFKDYLKYSSRLKDLIQSHIIDMLVSGLTVVLDFPGNTKQQRYWFKELFSNHHIPHQLIYLQADDALCLKRIKKRRTEYPERQAFDTKEVFGYVTSFFEEPSKEEGFNIQVIKQK